MIELPYGATILPAADGDSCPECGRGGLRAAARRFLEFLEVR